MSGVPDGVANGPGRSEHTGKDAQIWERPWTLEEIRQSSDNWSLAADSGLFLYLQDFSQRMLSKTHEIEKQLDSLIRDTKSTDSCLHSVFNDFLMLSNTQFIENRVYDEEVEETVPKADALEKQPEQKTREQKEAELIPKMQEAVNYGLTVLESAFEHLDIKAGNSDSEDEEVADRGETILEPKDLYVDRPLPFLIGSQAFMEQDDVGLGDLSSDEVSVDSDRDSVIESEDEEKEPDQSDDDFTQEEDEGHNSMKKKSSLLSYEDDEEDEEDEDSDIFGDSDKDDDEDTKNTGPSSFADELAARIKGEPVNKPAADRASLTSKKKSKGRKEPKPAKPRVADDDSDDMFKPPKMDDDDFSPFGGKGGLFSGGKGLFDDDDEGDLFSEAPKLPVSKEETSVNDSVKNSTQTSVSDNPGKKVPAGAVPIFPDNSLFSSSNDSAESKENGSLAAKTHSTSKLVGATGGGSGLFDDEDEEDDFFSSKSLKTPDSAGQEKTKSKTAIDLFHDDDEDGDIFSEKYSASNPTPNKNVVVEEQDKPPEKKMPAGAISMFGPGTKSLLSEGLKKRRPSKSEESEKSEENGIVPDVGKAVAPTQKLQTSGLFSDDEDTQVFPSIPKSQSKPELSRAKIGKPPVSLFDDEEEEDLFASVAKSKPKPDQDKASTPQPSKAPASSLFSDDEDQWLSSTSSAAKQEVKTGGMKPSASAPSGLLGVKAAQRSSLFDDDEDDLFAPTKESSQKKPQRVALLFEDEEEGSIFGIKPAVNTAAPASKTEAVDSQSNSMLQKSEAASQNAAEEKPTDQDKPAVKSPETPETSDTKKKPVGAVSLFGGIDVLANKPTKSLLNEAEDDSFLSKDRPPPNKKEEKQEEKVKTNTVSLFDDEENEESDWNEPLLPPSKPTARSTLKPSEDRAQTKSTGVFQDEELLFSHTQQKDNDPDVDIFATSGNAPSSKLCSGKSAAPSLFADDDEDDLFSSIKPKTLPPKVSEKPSVSKDRAPLVSPAPVVSDIQKPAPSTVKPKEPSSRIGKLQASLMINPAVLVPGAVRSLPGAVLPGRDPSSSSGVSSSSLSPSPATTPAGAQPAAEAAVSFDSPVQVATLQSTHKSRVKGSAHRRPQSRAARQQAALSSAVAPDSVPGLPGLVPPPPDKPSQSRPIQTSLNSAPLSSSSSSSSSSPSKPLLPEVSSRPSVLTLPEPAKSEEQDSTKSSSSTKVLPSADEDDLFGSDSLFGDPLVLDTPSSRHTTKTPPESEKDQDKSPLPSIFDDNGDDLFQKVKPKSSAKKSSTFLEEEDDDEDIFGVSNNAIPSSTCSKDIKNSSSFSKQDIFKDDVPTVPRGHKKSKEKPMDASLFDDNIDIFADLTDSLKPKPKSKSKVDTKSIFDDDMDDIFSPGTVKPAAKAPPKSKKTPPSQETSPATESSNIFDDPLNALGGN